MADRRTIGAGAFALAAIAAALGASPGVAAADTGGDLLASCAASHAPESACRAYIQAVVDDSSLVDGNLDARYVASFGLFCVKPGVTFDRVYSAVIGELRRSPELRPYKAAMSVRLALARALPCPRPAPPRR